MCIGTDRRLRSPCFRHHADAQRGFAVVIPAYTGTIASTELAKSRAEASTLVRLIQLEHQHGRRGQGFFSAKGVNTGSYGTPDVDEWLEQLASCTDVVAGDAYGQRVLFPYWPYQAYYGNNEMPLNVLLAKLLVSTPGFSGRDLMNSTAPYYRYSTRTAAAQLRDPVPVLPWLFSKDVAFVLGARDKPRVAFTYNWVERTLLSEKAPPGVPTCEHAGFITHKVDVPYNTNVPLLCTFAPPPQPRLLSGSFFASPSDDDDGGCAFYRGMAPSALMQRRQQHAMDTS
jgi:hypothetical protein